MSSRESDARWFYERARTWRSFCGEARRKTIVLVVRKSCYLGSRTNMQSRIHIIWSEGSSELKPQCGFGACAQALHTANLSIIKYLCDSRSSVTLAEAVH